MKKKILHYQYKPGMYIPLYVHEFNKLNVDLQNLDDDDDDMKDQHKALILIGALPESFDNLVTTVLHGKKTITLDEVCDIETSISNHFRR